jgi:hypothetical protein
MRHFFRSSVSGDIPHEPGHSSDLALVATGDTLWAMSSNEWDSLAAGQW